ncbi:cellulose biosynthesis regulator YedQ [Enterobacteriaceae bacterium]
MHAATLTRRMFWGQSPKRVVNLCFLVVLICSALFTWRELIVLQHAYATSQRNGLENVAIGLDRHLQFSLDKLLFYRNAMQLALAQPLNTDISRQMLADFEAQRDEHTWQLLGNNHRSMPMNGVSDAFVNQSKLLHRDESRLAGELSAALEFGYLMHLSGGGGGGNGELQQSSWYTSRAGFFIASDIAPGAPALLPAYYHQVTRPWFFEQSPENNRTRGVVWFYLYDPVRNVQTLTASVPLDYQHYWYGVVAMDFPVATINRYLQQIVDDADKGEVYLFDSRFRAIASSQDAPAADTLFDSVDMARLAGEVEKSSQGGMRFDTRYVSWQKLNNFSGVLISVHSIEQSMQAEFGTITVVLMAFWTLFLAMLLVSWLMIRRMVDKMTQLQNKLTWQAWYDPLTRLYNRGAFFERAQVLVETAEKHHAPYSLIQFDLDHFKSINDRYGHQAGDRVLRHAGTLLAALLREGDIAGRVGGEEFCVLLPNTELSEATQFAERVRARLNAREILLSPTTSLRFSASFGVSSSAEAGIYAFEKLQAIADDRLYKAKQGGRNQVRAD